VFVPVLILPLKFISCDANVDLTIHEKLNVANCVFEFVTPCNCIIKSDPDVGGRFPDVCGTPYIEIAPDVLKEKFIYADVPLVQLLTLTVHII
jgi:hypothetical protein